MHAAIIMVMAGMLLPFQTAVNSRLRISVGSPFLSSLISFSLGTVFLAVIATVLTGSPFFDLSTVSGQPAWIWLGGLLGALGLTTSIFVFPLLGGILTVILPIFGQMIAGLIIDYFGLLGAPVVPLTPFRLLSVALLLCGVILTVLAGNRAAPRPRQQKARGKSPQTPSEIASKLSSAKPESSLKSFDFSRLFLQILALITGFVITIQSVINARLGIVVGSSLHAALVSFAIGAVILFLIVLTLRVPLRVSIPSGASRNPWWMWIGGPLGATFVTLNAVFIPILGTGMTVMAFQTGMITASVIVDKYGLLQAPKRPVSAMHLIGIAIMLTGVVLAYFS